MSDIRLIAIWRDDPQVARMQVDLRAEEGRIASPWDLFGAFDAEGASARPFILRRDGRIDFDARCMESWRTDVRDAEMKIGARFKVWWNETDCGDYEVVKLAALGSRTTDAQAASRGEM